ncbi:MAG: hypothetical protein HYY24_05360 [Verrucomicrobia bacterium]|nr:hypothetical protein [Verrucomicrobiota bacterium]
MFATTLQLSLIAGDTAKSQASDPDVHFFAVGGPSADFASYEISDLTIDCNMAGQPPTVINQVSLGYAKACCGAIRLFGKNLKIHRVRAINWGRRGAQLELFPLVAVAPGLPQHAAEEMSNVIEDCIIEQPDWNTGDQATLISAQVIRNCFVRGDRVRPGPFPQIPVLSLTYSGDRVTLKTPFSHQLTTDDRITVRGVMVGGQLSTLFNGNFDVDAVPSPKTLEYLLSESGSGTPTGTITVGRESKPTLKVKALNGAQVGDPPVSVAKLQTDVPHNRALEEWIVVSGVLDANGQDDSVYNGAFKVHALDTNDPTVLYYKWLSPDSDPGVEATGDIWLDRITAQRVVISGVAKDPPATPDKLLITTASPHYRAKDDWVQLVDLSPATLDGYYKVLEEGLKRNEFKVQPASLPGGEVGKTGTSTVLLNLHQALTGNSRIVERNRVWHCFVGVYHDTWTRQDLVVRHNYFYDVAWAVQEALWDNDSSYDVQRRGTAAHSGGVVTVTVNSQTTFGLTEGAIVEISGDPNYNGFYRIRNVKPADRTFQYDKPGSSPDSGTLTIKEYFQSWRVIVEKNIIEQALRIKDGQNHPPPWGIPMGGFSFPYSHPGLYLLHNLLLRGNLIRPRDGATAPGQTSDPDKNPFGIFIDSAQNVVMEGNLINVFDVSRRSMLVSYSEAIKTLNNSRFDGTPLRAQRIQYVPTETELGHFPDFLDSLQEAILLRGMKKP